MLKKTGFILVATFLIDRVGRRPLLLLSTIGMSVSLIALALSFSLIENTSGHHQGFASFFGYVGSMLECGIFLHWIRANMLGFVVRGIPTENPVACSMPGKWLSASL